MTPPFSPLIAELGPRTSVILAATAGRKLWLRVVAMDDIVRLGYTNGKLVEVALPLTDKGWTGLDVPAAFVADAHKIAPTWSHEEWESATLDGIEIVP